MILNREVLIERFKHLNMKTAIELDERLVNENEEKLQSLLVENRGLKEMLKIRTKYGGGGINGRKKIIFFLGFIYLINVYIYLYKYSYE